MLSEEMPMSPSHAQLSPDHAARVRRTNERSSTEEAGVSGVQMLMAAGGNQAMVQLSGDGQGSSDVHAAASAGISGNSGRLPHLDAIQRSFGGHDVSGVQAHTDGAATGANKAMGAQAYATGNHVAFGGAPSLHTAAHEAAHVVQQRAGVSLSGGVGKTGDSYERNADAVADRVVQGKSAEDLLGPAKGGGGGGGVQRAVQKEEAPAAPVKEPDSEGNEDEESAKWSIFGGGKGKSSKKEETKKPEEKTPKHDATAFEKAPQLKKIKESIIQALKITKAALAHVKKGDSAYQTWMDKKAKSSATDGAVDTRIASVKSGFEKIQKCLEEDTVIFKKWDLPTTHKLKEDTTFGYVRKAETDNNIYLGGSFWVAKTKGIDSSAGTIVHELSHRLHNTSDHGYGTGKAKGFAKDDPDKATTNADNYEYLAEKA
ncbi:MAG: DUF4157 domain-containing protein [Deltaproteobacteria bacterium]|nr:MAG: DUF4157 domain-containing protein [Deltaproteobacteria bacterium]